MFADVPNSAQVTAWKNVGTPIPPCSGLHDVESQPSPIPCLYASLNSCGILIEPFSNLIPSLSPS